MNAPRPSFLACVLRAISPSLLLAMAAAALLVQSVLELGVLNQRAHDINAQIALARASIVAETALLEQSNSSEWPREMEIAGLSVEVDRDEEQFWVSMQGSSGLTNGLAKVSARRLPGAAPLAFSQKRAAWNSDALVAMGGGWLADSANWPQLSCEQVQAAACVSETTGFHRDAEIALRYLEAGTDRPDYLWSSGQAVEVAAGGKMLMVPGNLWLDAAEQPFELHLTGDLVLVVCGNLHVLCSLVVTGPGRLLLVTDAAPDAVVFADCDASGGWSSGDRLCVGEVFGGPVEGTGSVYLGLPGIAASLRCDAGILVGGELHLASPAEVRGPLLLRHGLTTLRNPALTTGHAVLQDAGAQQWVFRLGRDCVPGFAVTGEPRPGRLQFRLR